MRLAAAEAAAWGRDPPPARLACRSARCLSRMVPGCVHWEMSIVGGACVAADQQMAGLSCSGVVVAPLSLRQSAVKPLASPTSRLTMYSTSAGVSRPASLAAGSGAALPSCTLPGQRGSSDGREIMRSCGSQGRHGSSRSSSSFSGAGFAGGRRRRGASSSRTAS